MSCCEGLKLLSGHQVAKKEAMTNKKDSVLMCKAKQRCGIPCGLSRGNFTSSS